MPFTHSIARWLSKPLTLWLSFALVLLTAGSGLVALSQHALRLSRLQSESEQREDMQQNMRVALWRLDSRLAPYLATLHDLSGGNRLAQADEDFVVHRFRVAGYQGKGTPPSQPVYVPVTSSSADGTVYPFGPGSEEQWRELRESIPIAAVVDYIGKLNRDSFDSLPGNAPMSQSLVQNYGSQVVQSPDEISGRELFSRNSAVQQQVAANTLEIQGFQQALGESLPDHLPVKLIPFWFQQHLVLVRMGPRGTVNTLDGAWLDWPALKESLLADVDDLVPAADLLPVRPSDVVDPSRTLAALPAMIVPTQSEHPVEVWSPTHNALALTWLVFAGAALIAAVALSRLISLSERRASFVSAVTHELRTPLTTFRLYSDLLARNMVQDPNDRIEYLQTLRREADRLSHLVDNVLRYSRLERTSTRPELEPVVLSHWIKRITPRLDDRLSSADMELVVQQDGDGTWMTDPAAMEQVIFNLVDNAAKYAQQATDRRVHFTIEMSDRSVQLTVDDHGPGVPPSLQPTVFQPFSKSAERAAETAAGVGLGLALARQTVATLGGKLIYQKSKQGGASFRVTMPRSDARRSPDKP